jgi:hypothetical protein
MEELKVTRLVLVGPNGREKDVLGARVALDVQDGGQTLKVFYNVDKDLETKVRDKIISSWSIPEDDDVLDEVSALQLEDLE